MHYITGGLGSAVADVLMEKPNSPRLVKMGIDNKYSVVGDYGFLLQQHGLTPEGISQTILKELEK